MYYCLYVFLTYKFTGVSPHFLATNSLQPSEILRMSSLSVSQSSSSSDWSRSGTSTPSSDFLPSTLFLLPPSFINANQLKAFASKLEKGYGDKILLSVVHEAIRDNANGLLPQAMAKLADAVPDARTTGKQWVKIPEGGHNSHQFFRDLTSLVRTIVLPSRHLTWSTCRKILCR
ncbi:hypothetical protein PAXRUDRAFT_239683 [Paxillus rubicundulus Ve08.2h10]|uniref:Uncharacterized protein n=1 Tax=Paxillus rubicundulus Ve08.2h10 TaxID=930991 RepID=A0A0D0D9E0_9AGAM|nr:hypothetical protein PAXRUDRAFT_239683 [Paxillus rubicundulus Ve08.2h10]